MGYTAADTAHVLLAVGLLIAAAQGGGFLAAGLVGSSHEASVGLPALLGVERYPVQSAAYHLAAALVLFGVGIGFGPQAFAALTRSRWNIIHRSSPVAFRLVVMLTLSAVSLLAGVAPLFGAFIAGIITAPT